MQISTLTSALCQPQRGKYREEMSFLSQTKKSAGGALKSRCKLGSLEGLKDDEVERDVKNVLEHLTG